MAQYSGYLSFTRCAIYSKPISTKIFAVILSMCICVRERKNFRTGLLVSRETLQEVTVELRLKR